MGIDVNILNEQSQTADKELFSNLGTGKGANISWQWRTSVLRRVFDYESKNTCITQHKIEYENSEAVWFF